MARLQTMLVLLLGGLASVGIVSILTREAAGPEVRLGMTRAAVECLLGQEGHEYHVDYGPTEAICRRRHYPTSDRYYGYYVWYSPDQVVVGGTRHRPPTTLEAFELRVATAFGVQQGSVNAGHLFRR